MSDELAQALHDVLSGRSKLYMIPSVGGCVSPHPKARRVVDKREMRGVPPAIPQMCFGQSVVCGLYDPVIPCPSGALEVTAPLRKTFVTPMVGWMLGFRRAIADIAPELAATGHLPTSDVDSDWDQYVGAGDALVGKLREQGYDSVLTTNVQGQILVAILDATTTQMVRSSGAQAVHSPWHGVRAALAAGVETLKGVLRTAPPLQRENLAEDGERLLSVQQTERGFIIVGRNQGALVPDASGRWLYPKFAPVRPDGETAVFDTKEAAQTVREKVRRRLSHADSAR